MNFSKDQQSATMCNNTVQKQEELHNFLTHENAHFVPKIVMKHCKENSLVVAVSLRQ